MKHVFKRKEEKFILPLQIAEDVKKLAVKKLGFSEFNKDGKLTDIRTTYFENDEFLIYHLKKSRKKKRYKIRIREYGRNGIFEPTIWIELKEKIDGVGYKSRFKIERKLLNDFLDGKTIFSHVVKINNEVNIDYL
ncbi:MAG: VTC domain-containing protein, partial [bacterium]|nr:VTC domain-containing protein [bacterium]